MPYRVALVALAGENLYGYVYVLGVGSDGYLKSDSVCPTPVFL